MTSKRIIGIIPARYGSTRLAGKPLLEINGKPMIQLVYENAKKSKFLKEVIVATDDLRIKEAVLKFGGKAVLTAAEIATGTDRCFKALKSLDEDFDAVVNIQGDEPLLKTNIIDETIQKFLDNYELADAGTAIFSSNDETDIANPNKVKVVLDSKNFAIYFSRSPIPYPRNPHSNYNLHIGLYIYKTIFLEKFIKLNQPQIEIAESLEQLRILFYGYKIICQKVAYQPHGVDTQEDLEKVRKIIQQN